MVTEVENRGDEVARECTDVRVREPELTVQCRTAKVWLGAALLDAGVQGWCGDVADLGLRVVEHDVGRNPAVVPLATLDVVQGVDGGVLPGVVEDVARHVQPDAEGGVVAGALGVGAERAAAEDLDARAVVDVVRHRLVGVGRVATAVDGVAASLLARCGAGARTVDVVHVVAGGLTFGAAAGDQQRGEKHRCAGEERIAWTKRRTRRVLRGSPCLDVAHLKKPSF